MTHVLHVLVRCISIKSRASIKELPDRRQGGRFAHKTIRRGTMLGTCVRALLFWSLQFSKFCETRA
jgi:hypothetical protein